MTLTREQIELIRAVLSDGTYTKLEQKDFNALCDMALALMSAQAALAQAKAWTEEEEGFTLQYIIESDERQIERNGKHAWNRRFVDMCRAVQGALASPKGEQQTHTGAADES